MVFSAKFCAANASSTNATLGRLVPSAVLKKTRKTVILLSVVQTDLNSIVRRLIGEQAKIPATASELADSDDLYDHGMTSHSSVMLMLGLENEFGVEFPDTMLTRDVFSSVNAIESAIRRLQQELT